MAYTTNVKLTISQQKAINRISSEMGLYWLENSKCYDRQYISYINDNGERFVVVRMYDFRKDPSGFKPYFANTWIEGWHG